MRLWLLSFSLFIWSSCQNNVQTSTDLLSDSTQTDQNLDLSIKGNFSTQRILKLNPQDIDQFFIHLPEIQTYDSAVKTFYALREFRYAWFDENGLTEPANNLFNRLSNLKDEGLRLFPPYIDLLDSLMMEDQILSVEKDIQTELLLSTLYFYYAKNVWEGIDEKESIAQEWYLPRKKINAVELLDSLLSNNDRTDLQRPIFQQYYLLRNYLKQYHEIAEKGGWQIISTQQKKIQLNDSLPEIIHIKNRLHITGELLENDSTALYNENLFNAVKKFQEKHGLEEDGIIGPAVLKAMNVSVEKRIEQLMVNMERCRWMPLQPSKEYLVVNIPDFKLFAFYGDSLLWKMNVVVGKALHNTVVFYGELKYVVFSPYWNVPNSIYKSEIVPAMKKDSNYLRKNNMEVFGNTVRQKPGPSNSLGLVKFLFPNSYNIYLHDSPAKELFSKSSRAFSHGCVRVADPLFLSKYLLKHDSTWTEEKILQAMHAGKEKYIQLSETMPVYITYLTAFVSADGEMHFRDDIYNRDTRLIKTILRK